MNTAEKFDCIARVCAALPIELCTVINDGYAHNKVVHELVMYVLTQQLPVRRIETNGDVYLTRYTVCEHNDGQHVYLHRIHRPDLAQELHDHPWAFDALILHGGYVEQRWIDSRRVNILRQPMTAYHCDDTTYHRIADLPNGDCWSLVVTRPKSKSWSFWMPETSVVTPWRKFVGVE